MRKALGLLVPMLAILVLAALPGLAQPAPAPSCGCPTAAPSATGVPMSACPVAPVTVYPAPVTVYPAVPVTVYPATPIAIDLLPYLQAEVNEVAVLSAQSASLRQQGDTVGADLIASYIPDHQMQVARLRALLGNTPQVLWLQPNESPFLGSFADILAHDASAHAAAMDQYRVLLQQTVTNPVLHQLALEGLNGASRHFSSITVAQATVSPSSVSERSGLMAALTLEKGEVADLMTQATQLRAIGDLQAANLLLSQIPAHQQQIASLSNAVLQNGGDPVFAVPALVPPLASRPEILADERISNLQMANTYAVPIALAPTSQLALLAQNGRQIALQGFSLASTPIV